ncbi:MAG: Gfo/Idh/MocA family protein [Terriglobia bacterium]
MPIDFQQTPRLPQTIRPIVIIGAGSIVRDAHLPAYRKAGFRVESLYDVNQARATSLAHEFGAGRVPSSLDQAIGEAPPGAVFDVAVPAPAILDVLPHLPDGCAVLIQKPLGENLAQAREIVATCRRKNLKAAVNFQLRYAPYVVAVRSLIEQGLAGGLHSLEVRVAVHTPWELWSFLKNNPRVEILYHSIHYLDLVRSFLGEPLGVYAKTTRHPQAPDLAATRSCLILDYGESVHACISATHGHVFGRRYQESFIRWETTRGAMVAKMGVSLDYPRGEPDELDVCLLDGTGRPNWESVPLHGSWFPDAFIGTMASVMRWAEGSDGPAPTAVEDAIKTMALVEAAYQSSASGGTSIPNSSPGRSWSGRSVACSDK